MLKKGSWEELGAQSEFRKRGTKIQRKDTKARRHKEGVELLKMTIDSLARCYLISENQ